MIRSLPQRFYFNLSQSSEGIDVVEKIEMSEKDALHLDIYHDAVNFLVPLDGYMYNIQEDGTNPKYVAINGEYLYSADNYFHDEFIIYNATVSLALKNKQPSDLVFRFFDEQGSLFDTKTLTISLEDIAARDDLGEALEHVAEMVRDNCVALKALAHTQNWSGTPFGPPMTVFPDYMVYNPRMLEEIIIPKYIRDTDGNKYKNVSKAIVSSYSGYGRDAQLNISFLSGDTLHEQPIAIQTFLEESIEADCYTNKGLYRNDDTVPMQSWHALYG